MCLNVEWLLMDMGSKCCLKKIRLQIFWQRGACIFSSLREVFLRCVRRHHRLRILQPSLINFRTGCDASAACTKRRPSSISHTCKSTQQWKLQKSPLGVGDLYRKCLSHFVKKWLLHFTYLCCIQCRRCSFFKGSFSSTKFEPSRAISYMHTPHK